MSKYIELIDKYRIEQSQDGDYNPPSYIWTDNTGEIVRCGDCKYWTGDKEYQCPWDLENNGMPDAYDYCSNGEKRDGNNS